MIDFSLWIVHAFVILNLISITTYLGLPPANKIYLQPEYKTKPCRGGGQCRNHQRYDKNHFLICVLI